MCSSAFTLLPLHENPQFLGECCKMLNEEWKRSVTARMHSLEKSNYQLPLSLVLVDYTNSEYSALVGHARLCRVLDDTSACLVESVIIKEAKRGTGLGKKLMTEVETYAKRLGFNIIYLTTDDKESFYQHLGYSPCKPVCSVNGTWKSNLVSKISQSYHVKDEKSCTNELKLPFLANAGVSPPPLPQLEAMGNGLLTVVKRTVWLNKHI